MTLSDTVAGALAGELRALGVRDLFGLVGEDTIGFVTAVGAAGIRYYGTRHENVAVGMADGYAWRSGGLGVCTVTRGAGVLNAAMALRTAARAGRRVLVVCGDVGTAADRTWDFKSIEHEQLVRAIGAEHVAVRSPEEAVPALRRAAALAAAGATVVLSVAVDVLHAPAVHAADAGPAAGPAAHEQVPEPTAAAVAEAAALLAAAERPLILAGRGALHLRAPLEALAARTGALLGTTLLARDLFLGSPYDAGIVGGFASDPVVPLLAQVDVALVVGASLNPWTTGGMTLFRDVPVIHVDRDAARIGESTPVALGICADAGATVRRLLESVMERDGTAPFHAADVLARLRRPLWAGPDESTADELDPRAVTTHVDLLVPEERTIVLDSGRHLNSAARYMRFLAPQQFRLTADGGAIGMGLGVALGAKVARPDVPAVLFAGDGGTSMTLGDLETAVRHRLPLTIVVQNDRAYGSELVHCVQHDLPWDHAQLPEIDFAAAARALGLEAATVRTLDELKAAIGDPVARDAPLLLDCRIRQDIFVPRVTW